MIETNQTHIVPVAFVVIENNGRYLLIQEAKEEVRGAWYLPAGRMEAGETIIDTAHREVREEAGISVELTGLMYFEQFVDRRPEARATRLRFVFAGRDQDGRLKTIEDEHSIQAKWFSPDEIGTLRTRTPFVGHMVSLHRQNPPMLPISFFRGL